MSSTVNLNASKKKLIDFLGIHFYILQTSGNFRFKLNCLIIILNFVKLQNFFIYYKYYINFVCIQIRFKNAAIIKAYLITNNKC